MTHKEKFLERLPLLIESIPLFIIWISEFAGVQVTIWTPNIFIPAYLMLLWMVVQGLVSVLLIIHTFNSIILHKDKDVWRFLNIVVICILLQYLGFQFSLQWFGAAVAMTNSVFIYRYNEPLQI